VARGLAGALGVSGVSAAPPHDHAQWLKAVAKDLGAHSGGSLVLAGERQPPMVHVLAHAMNEHLGNVGQTVIHTDPVEARPEDQLASLRGLVRDMQERRVEVLVILGGNPVYTAPADLPFAESMQNVPHRIHLSMFQDETSRQCHWHLPAAHYLESWSDARAFDGTASIVQPLIEPLYQGKSAHEVLTALTDRLQTPGLDTVRSHWRQFWHEQGSKGSFDDFWQSAVHDGVIPGTQLAHRPARLIENWQRHLHQPQLGPQAATAGEAVANSKPEYELAFEPDPTIYDGTFANNGWLQELPKPITKLTWDNALLMSPTSAEELGVGLGGYAHGGEHGGYEVDVVEVRLGERTLEAPVWIVPGHAEGAVTISLGYGREAAGRIGGSREQPLGVNAYVLRTSDYPWSAPGVQLVRTGRKYALACTQRHHLMESRDLVRAGRLGEFQATKKESEHGHEASRAARTPLTLYEPFDYEPPRHKWGMAIDLTACTGCQACVVACQAENNIPIVGKDQVLAGREMHWLRIDRYIGGPYSKPREFYFQPVPCMHCENAPCEYVCPVAATVHSAEGLNDMVYQRCVGTRFCSNNCPYKVRRFNFFHFADYATESLRLQYNPDVTVRSRGVMEKCSYCVQRIRHAQIDAEREQRPIADGEILTACQAACPAEAIVFGDMNDSHSQVAEWKASPLDYALLDELNTQPRTTYLAALRNPNPELEIV
jgi:molybdopterin-containing oxidoreductase family iron-sulfur binding subunit